MGLVAATPRAIGPHRAKEISLSARSVPAEEAAELGFVTRVVADDDLLPAARAAALAIAQWPADHIGRIKSLLDRGYEMPLGEALRFEAEQTRASNAQVTLPVRS